MTIQFAFFASPRYWKDKAELDDVFFSLMIGLKDISPRAALITCEEELKALPPTGDCLVVVPMSGAVQPLILEACNSYTTTILYPMYIIGNGEKRWEARMLENNAAPTTMDCWAVLKRTHPHMQLALNKDKLKRCLKVFAAYLALQGATLLLIGDTEPWVISNSHNFADYEKLGVKIVPVQQSEVAQLYRETTKEAATPYYQYFTGEEATVAEPTDEDIWNACRMAAALMEILGRYKADGMALACFNLLAEGTNCCLGVSYINDCTPHIAACEGDVDSAVTMLAMKQIATTKLWMANPGLHPDGLVNFSHCTAPINPQNTGKCPHTLRNHHESGIGASLQVSYPLGLTVTACRISDAAEKMTVQTATVVEGEYENACRTQIYLRFEDFNHYIESALGCHQVFAFEDISEEMALLGKQLGLTLL